MRGFIRFDNIFENEIRDIKKIDISRCQRRILEIAGRTIVLSGEGFLRMKAMDEKRDEKENQDKSKVEISFLGSNVHYCYLNAIKTEKESQ
jgi:hypothetical protein